MSREQRVAVIGMAFRFAGGDSPEAFWQTVRGGVVARGLPDTAGFFQISRQEADPQQRMFLECAYRALEDGGYAATGQDTTIGVYGSAGYDSDVAVDVATQAVHRLGLAGPALNVLDGLLAVHLACQGLRAGHADLALAGAASVWTAGQQLEHLSPTGECRAFDVDANGTVGGSAVVAVLLKPLEQALSDRDTVHAVVEGIGLTTEAVLRTCGLTARDVGYLEAHATGDPRDDRTELAALTSAYRQHTTEAGFCALGTVKPAIGHTGACSGLAGLIKAILVLRHGEIPPLPGFRRPHPQLSLDDSPFFLPTRPQAWPAGDKPRRAAVHTPGVHVVLAEPLRQADRLGMSQEAALADKRREQQLRLAVPMTGNDEAWWRGYLGDEPPVLRVPTDRPRGRGETMAGASVVAAGLPAGATTRLQMWSDNHDVTLFVCLATAWQVVLRRFSGQDEFLLGTTVGVRRPLRCGISDSLSLGDAAARLRDDLAAVATHGETPPDDSLTPVSIDLDGGQPAKELSLIVTRDGDGLNLRLTYDSALFDEGSVRWYLDHLVLVLETMGTGQTDLIGDLPMVSGRDAAALRKLGAGDLLPAFVPLPGAVDPRGGAEIAVVHESERWTRDRLRAAAEALAGRLADVGVGRGDVVTLALPRTPAYVAALLAVTRLGAAYLPLDLAQPSSRLTAMLTDARPAVIVTDDTARPLPSGTTVLIVQDLPAHTGNAPQRRVPAPADLISLLYTSGSTGGPKGVETTYGNLAALLAGYQQRHPIDADDRLAWFSSPGFDSAQAEIWPALIHGARLHIVPDILRLDPRGLAQWLVRHRITQIIVPTPIGEQLLQQDWPADTALRRLITGGEQLNRRPARDLPFEVVNVYGPTETTVFVATGPVASEGLGRSPLGRSPLGPPTLGRPMPGTLLEIRGAAGRLLPPGAPGELHIGGPQVAMGYRRVPELSAQRFHTGSDGIRRYASGDLARWRADGQLQFLGRADDQVQIRGLRVEPAEVTRALLTFDDIHDALVLGSSDPATGLSTLTAYVCPLEMPADHSSAIRSWRSRLAGLVPGPMVPDQWEVGDRLPTTVSGKRDRAGLRRSGIPQPVVESDRREEVRAAWRQVLDTDDIPDDAPFYDLGGHSLAVMRLLDLMEEQFGVRLSLADFFDDPTVDGIVRRFPLEAC